MRPHIRLRIAAVLIATLTLGAIAAYLWQVRVAQAELRKATLANAEKRASQLADVVSTQIEQLMRGVDLALQQLSRDYARDAATFQTTVHSVLGTLGGEALERVSVADAQGWVVYASTGLQGRVNVADREHFRFHANSDGDRLHISAPLYSRVTKRWVVLASRPIWKNGKFAGVMVISLFPEKLSEQLEHVALSRHDVVTLLRADGRFLARNRGWESAMGKSVQPDRPFLQPGSDHEGIFRAAGTLDGVNRIFAWRRLADDKLLVAVGMAEDSLLAPLQKDEKRESFINSVMILVMSLLGGAATLLLLRVAQQQQQIVLSEERYRMLHESMVDAYGWVDMNGNLVEWNSTFQKMLGYSPEELRAKSPQDITPSRWHDLEQKIIAEQVLVKGHSDVFEKEYIRSDGTIFPVEMRVFLLRNDQGNPVGMWAIVRDITERKLVEAQIQHLAHHDPLTGLPNRAALNVRLDQAIASAQRADSQLAIMLIDLDRFKSINDNLGHVIGDQLLVEVAHRLRMEVRASDIVARLGGDEFIIVLINVAGTPDIEAVAHKIRLALSAPYAIENHELHTTPSIGISLFPKDGGGADALIRHADAAMYQAKSQGRDNWQFYTEHISILAAERLKIENGLRNALRREEFILHYQPQLDLASDRIVAVEALVRWQHPVLGMVSPDRFISVAEEMGLIVPLGEWVLDRACAQLRAWRDTGLNGIRMCVNLSARQLRESTLHDSVRGCLERHGLDPADLELEITETMAMSNPAETIGTLKRLEALGVTMAIDDFGTGYSSLSYLKLLPIHRLKLDRSFVRDIETDPEDASICRATASLSHDLGLSFVAEGVETEAQFIFLKDLGCDLLQGYWLARPLSAAEARAMILRHNPSLR